MLLWHPNALKNVYPGRGLTVPIPGGPKKPPTRTKLWGDLLRAVNQKMTGFRAPADKKRQLSAWLVTGKEGAEQPFNADMAGLTFALTTRQRNYWTTETHPGTIKVVRFWVAAGGAEAVQSLIAAWGYYFHGEALGDVPSDGHFSSFKYDGNAFRGLSELRLQLARADEAVYAAAVAELRAQWPGLTSLPLKTALVYILPTEQDLAAEIAAAMKNTSRDNWNKVLSHTLAAPEVVLGLMARAEGWEHLHWLYGLLSVMGEALLPHLLTLSEEDERDWLLVGPISAIPSPASAAWLTRHEDDNEDKERFFLACPELALEHLPADSPLRATVLRANPELDPDAAPLLEDAALPKLLKAANAIKTRKALPKSWRVYGDLKVKGGGDAILSPDAYERLGTLLQRELGGSNEKLTKPLLALRDALDPESADAFALALMDGLSFRERSKEHRFVYKSLIVFSHDAAVNRMSAEVARQGYQEANNTLGILAAIGSDTALLRVNYVAQRGRGGIKKRALERIQEIARTRGLSQGQLADRLVPTLGLDPSGRMTLDYGPRQFTVGFDEALKPYVLDGAGERRVNLPKPSKKDDPAIAPAAEKRFKQLKKDARTLASVQIARFEDSLKVGRRWTGAEFKTYLSGHPLIRHLVRRLVWGVYGADDAPTATFRVDVEGGIVDREDDAFVLADDASVGIAHPLACPAEDIAAWGAVLSDYELLQPFPQLDRPVWIKGKEPVEALLARLTETKVPGGRMMSLMNKGWSRGAVEDAGIFHTVYRQLGDLRVTVHFDQGLGVYGEWGADEDQKLTVTVKGEAGPVAYSEAIHELSQVLGG